MEEDLKIVSGVVADFAHKHGKKDARGLLRVMDEELSKKKENPKGPIQKRGGGCESTKSISEFEWDYVNDVFGLINELQKIKIPCGGCGEMFTPPRKETVIVNKKWLEDLMISLVISNKKSVQVQTKIHEFLK